MRSIKRTAAMSATVLALAAGTASAATIPGHNYGEALYGTPRADTIYGYGGADLIKGFGGKDVLYGGNEAGWGDKILGGTNDDRVYGQKGDDGLYGGSGDDSVRGGYGNDLVRGDYGYDTLDGGPGADEINAQDGQKDTIVIRSGEYDTVYYDRGLDVLQGRAGMSAEEAIEAGKVKVVAEKPPEGLFEHTGKVLVEHKGEELLLAEKELEGHLGHGDEILDPTGRAEAEQGRR